MRIVQKIGRHSWRVLRDDERDAMQREHAHLRGQVRLLQDLLRRERDKNRKQTVLVDTSKDVARIVAKHWHRAAIENDWASTAHALACVLSALEGERDPAKLGVEPGSDDEFRIAAVSDQDPNSIHDFSRYLEPDEKDL